MKLSLRKSGVGVAALILAGCGGNSGPPQAVFPNTFFHNGADSLHYAIDYPDTTGGGRFPAFVMVNGSGKQTKIWNTGVSGALVSRGFIALRYDKRGTGNSSGRFEEVGVGNAAERVPLLASDVAAAVEVLRTNPLVDTTRIGLVGISQGGWIAPQAARLSGSVSYMLMFVGPTVTVGQEIAYSRAAEDASKSFAELSQVLREFVGPPGWDPRPDLDALSIPGLWLYGSDDRSIPTIENVGILEALAAAGKPYSWVVYPGVGHCLHNCGADVWPDIDSWLTSSGISP